MTWPLALVVGATSGYLSGALPFGYVAGRMRGIDIRQHGSGNIGATNVIRVLGKGIGIPVFILDMLKGWLPTFLVARWLSALGAGEQIVTAGAVITGMAAVLGHMFTFWLGFKGGKGVATATGALLGVAPIAVFGGFIVWLLFFAVTRYVSLASMMSTVGVVATMVIQMSRTGRWDWVMLAFGVLIMVLVFVRHRSNIGRILAGTEPKAGRKKQPA
jgi:glycerol-3-phosphate acyltransferase PlsY